MTTVSPTYAADALGGGGGALRSVLGRVDVRAKIQVLSCASPDAAHIRLSRGIISRAILESSTSAVELLVPGAARTVRFTVLTGEVQSILNGIDTKEWDPRKTMHCQPLFSGRASRQSTVQAIRPGGIVALL